MDRFIIEYPMIIGLTGGIASGKTYCSQWFADQGMPVIDADMIAREIVEPGSPILDELTTLLGPSILAPDGTLKRAQLRNIIFVDEIARQRVNALMHPVIRAEIWRKLQKHSSQNVLLVAPLLLENRLSEWCDVVVVVDVPIAMQISRGCTRDGKTRQDILHIINTQISRDKRLESANFIIDNSQTKAYTIAQCEVIYRHINRLHLEMTENLTPPTLIK